MPITDKQFNNVVALIEQAFERGGFLFNRFQNTPIQDIKEEQRYTRENIKEKLRKALNEIP